MPGRLYIAAGLAVVLALALILARQYRAHASLAIIAFIAGIAWSFAFAAVVSPHAAGLTFTVPAKIAAAIGDSINRIFPARLSPFLRALTIADAKDLTHDTAIYTALSMSGIAHIASVSGMHVSFLVSMLGFFARGRRLRVIVCIPVLLLFMAVTGFNPPVCRAVIMSFFVFIAPLVKRRSDGVTAVLAALLLILVVNPLLIAKISLQLSFLSTLGIVTVTPRVKLALDGRAPRRRLPRRAYNFVAESFAASVGALVFSMPLIAYYFGYVTLLAPVTNLLTVWAASFAFCGSLIAALFGLLAEPFGVAAAYIAAVPADWIFIAARAVAKIPFAAVYVSNVYILAWLAYTYAVFAAFFLARSPLRKILFPACGTALTLCLALLLTAFTPRGGLSVTAIDVGQGQSLVVSDGAATAVIDCGGA
jgi:competence protein ComEC